MLIPAAHWWAGVASSPVDAEQAAGLVKQSRGELLEIDHSSPLFVQVLPWIPRQTFTTSGVAATQPDSGPGTQLKKLLGRLGISADEPGCKCKSRAAYMDRQGCEWVAANMDTVVGWLREEAQRRGMPFIDAAGKILVREAVRRARKDAAANARGPQRQD